MSLLVMLLPPNRNRSEKLIKNRILVNEKGGIYLPPLINIPLSFWYSYLVRVGFVSFKFPDIQVAFYV